jgi:hypothetical protein
VYPRNAQPDAVWDANPGNRRITVLQKAAPIQNDMLPQMQEPLAKQLARQMENAQVVENTLLNVEGRNILRIRVESPLPGGVATRYATMYITTLNRQLLTLTYTYETPERNLELQAEANRFFEQIKFLRP